MALINREKLNFCYDLAVQLCYDMIREGVTTPESIAALLDKIGPTLTKDERETVLHLSHRCAHRDRYVLDENMLTCLTASQWTHALAALAVEYRWVAFDLEVSLGDRPDDPEKGRLRALEAEYYRTSIVGMYPHNFGSIIQAQLACEPLSDEAAGRWPVSPDAEERFYPPGTISMPKTTPN